jgi:radical SAM protein with 4Fe4S-binding SPASM domain
MSTELKVLNPDGYTHQPLPEIYALELTAACDLECPMCLRTTTMTRKPKLMPFDLIKQMHARGEFASTTFTELQMAGEPTIHPELGDIIAYLKDEVGVAVGLSTHGLNIHKPAVLRALLQLDTLTISLDSVDPDVYAKMRYPATLDRLVENLHILVANLDARSVAGQPLPFIDLQLIRTPLVPGSGALDAAIAFVKANGWERWFRIRMQDDMFLELDGRMIAGTMRRPGNGQLCLNPFTSVVVNQDGDVVSCCLIFQPNPHNNNYYGNLHENSLAAIWNGNRVRDFRWSHRSGALSGTDCAKCYGWSTIQIHGNILRGLVRK